MSRVASLRAAPAGGDPDYAEGLRAAVAAGVDIAIRIAARHDDATEPPPSKLMEQARLAARSGVGVDTVVRRYVAGHALITEFIFQEAEGSISLEELNRMLRALAKSLDRLIVAATSAFHEESEAMSNRGRHDRLTLVERLLTGEPCGAEELNYDLTLCHVGIVGTGADIDTCLHVAGRSLGARILSVSPAKEVVWAWLGRRERLDPSELATALAASRPSGGILAVGEAQRGLGGWQLSHRQARAAQRVGRRRDPGVVHYADVALLAAALVDEVLVLSLRDLYLKPLAEPVARATILRETLRRYFTANCNAAAAAAALGVNRNTVAARLREVEERLGRTITSCTAELELALSLEEIGQTVART
jgi:hypothetical protein